MLDLQRYIVYVNKNEVWLFYKDSEYKWLNEGNVSVSWRCEKVTKPERFRSSPYSFLAKLLLYNHTSCGITRDLFWQEVCKDLGMSAAASSQLIFVWCIETSALNHVILASSRETKFTWQLDWNEKWANGGNMGARRAPFLTLQCEGLQWYLRGGGPWNIHTEWGIPGWARPGDEFDLNDWWLVACRQSWQNGVTCRTSDLVGEYVCNTGITTSIGSPQLYWKWLREVKRNEMNHALSNLDRALAHAPV